MSEPMTGPAPTSQFPELEARYGALYPLGTGMQSRVYATAGGDSVLKIYRQGQGAAELEAANLRRAGLSDWVLGTVSGDGVEALVMRRLAGKTITAADLPAALPQLRELLGRLHGQSGGRVNLEHVRERLRRFRSVLAGQGLEDLFAAVEDPLERGLLDVPAAFCHLDLWQDNILIGPGAEFFSLTGPRRVGTTLCVTWPCSRPARWTC
ncbi:phosphotransferase family protein [Deinococcus lacus]|uniref:Phosphotransferase family protein n=1 Tax=Deinococcus lacus TaxID=392561 RepID=A0ABW1YA83_9DEIO